MKYDEFLTHVGENGGPSDQRQAEAVTRTVLSDLGMRLQDDEAEDLASQLPEELKGVLTVRSEDTQTSDDVDDFIRRVADDLGAGVVPEQARRYIQGVLRTVRAAVSDGQTKHVRAQLPAGFGPLFE